MLGVALLAGPFLVPVNTSGTLTYQEAANQMWDGKSQYLEANNHQIHFVTAGDKDSDRVLILLHGFGASTLSWKGVLEPLAANGFVVAFDRTAFGFTERPETWEGESPYSAASQLEVIDTFVDTFGKDKEVVLVGHSAGGTLAASYAVLHPEKVSALVLEDPAILSSGGSREWLKPIYSIPQVDHIGPLLVASIASSGLETLDKSYFDVSKITEQTRGYYTSPLQIAGWEKAFWDFNQAAKPSTVKDDIASIKTRTLIITGDADTIVDTADSVRLNQLMSGSEFALIENCGHLPHEEQAAEFLAAVNAFLRS